MINPYSKLCKRWLTTGALLILFAFPGLFSISGCGSDSSNPSPPAVSPLIGGETLQEWIDNGYKDDDGNDVVILNYGSGDHIIGAHAGPEKMDRSNGIAIIKGMVLDGPTMDEKIQELGIDGDTTIVFTGTSLSRLTSRARGWWTFLYWGFDKENLKVLDGIIDQVMDARYLASEATPAPTPSSYSVKSHTLNSGIVAILDDIIVFADGERDGKVLLDVRSDEEWNGSNFGTNAFGGHVTGAKQIDWINLVDGTTGEFIPKADIEAQLAAEGINSTGTIYIYCGTGTRASVIMFALFEILEWEGARIWDGSWSEWGNMAAWQDAWGDVDPFRDLTGSVWRTDTEARTDNLTYNTSAPTTPFELSDLNHPSADFVIVEDSNYIAEQ